MVEITYQAQLQKKLACIENQGQNILCYYGRSGIGKTELSKSLFKLLKPNYPACLWLDGEGIFDFESVRKPVEPVLMQMRSQLSKNRVNLRSFDLAYLIYRAAANPLIATISLEAAKGKNAAEKLKNALDLTDAFVQMNFGDLAPVLLEGVFEVVKNGLPGGKAIATLGWFLMQHSEGLYKWWIERGNEDLRELNDCISPYDILEKLPLFFARDLQNYLRSAGEAGVIFIDGYDKFLDASGRCNWLEKLISYKNSKLLWVIFSQQKLNFIDTVENVPIVPLTTAECQIILSEKGINDPEICQTIIQASQGVRFHLNLSIQTWLDISKKRQPQVEDFARNLSEVLRKQDAAWEPDELRMWQVLSNCRTWNQEIFNELMVQFKLEKWQNQFAKIIASEYVEEVNVKVDVNLWRLHPLMYQHLQLNQPEDLRLLVNSWLGNYYQLEYQKIKTQSLELAATALIETIYHTLDYYTLESEQSEIRINWCLQEITALQQQGKHRIIVPILEYVLENPSFTNNGKWAALTGTLLGKSLKVMGDNDRALKTLETARSQWQTLDLSESLEAATVELELAGLYHRMNRTFDADKASDRALSIRTKLLGKNSPEVAEALNSQAEIAASQGYYRQAVNYCDRALKILQSHPDTQPLQLAQVKFTAAWLNVYNNNLDAAERLLQEALEMVVSAASEEHPLAISCQASLGDIYQQMGSHQYQKAFDRYSIALDASEEYLGISHWQTLNLLKALASFCRKLGEYEKAEEFTTRHNDNVGIGDWEETAEFAMKLNNIAFSLWQKGEYGKAEPMFNQALQIRLKVQREEHPDTASSLNNLAELYKSQGRYDEAEPMYNQALQIWLKVLEKNDPDTRPTALQP
ncbi:MAG: tetratricopeptide repeat protein, partial [Microcoleus sp. SM1_3_4]|nr:tetratricopeptide repeat protein [Microcoleus sp. SM1_3_4]